MNKCCSPNHLLLSLLLLLLLFLFQMGLAEGSKIIQTIATTDTTEGVRSWEGGRGGGREGQYREGVGSFFWDVLLLIFGQEEEDEVRQPPLSDRDAIHLRVEECLREGGWEGGREGGQDE